MLYHLVPSARRRQVRCHKSKRALSAGNKCESLQSLSLWRNSCIKLRLKCCSLRLHLIPLTCGFLWFLISSSCYRRLWDQLQRTAESVVIQCLDEFQELADQVEPLQVASYLSLQLKRKQSASKRPSSSDKGEHTRVASAHLARCSGCFVDQKLNVRYTVCAVYLSQSCPFVLCIRTYSRYGWKAIGGSTREMLPSLPLQDSDLITGWRLCFSAEE